MTVTLGDLRGGLKRALDSIPGLYATATEVAQPRLPAAWPLPERYPEAENFDGLTTYTFSIMVLVGAGEVNRAQTALDTYISRTGSHSVRGALLADPSLGLGDDVRVMGFRFIGDYRIMDTSAGRALGCRFEVDVNAP